MSSVSRFRCVLFDLDETLLDFSASESFALKTAAGAFGFLPDGPALSLYREINRGVWTDFEKGLVSKERLVVARFEKFLAALGVNADPSEFNRAYIAALSGHAVLLPGAAKTVRALFERGILLYVVTNGVSLSAKGRLLKSGLSPFFSGIFVSEDVGASKPSPEYFRFVLESISEKDKNKILIVGDSPSSDISGGAAAGIFTCLFDPSGQKPCSPAPDYRIETLPRLENILFAPADD